MSKLYHHIPNFITVLRIVLIPLFVALILYERYYYSLYIYIIAGISDTLDGYLARKLESFSELGKLLDPIADKFLLITSFVLFTYLEWIPVWFTVTVLSRDLFIVIGWVLMFLIFNTRTVQPSITGKVSIAIQMVLVGYILLGNTISHDLAGTEILIWASAVFTVVSGLQYIYRGLNYGDA